MSRKKQAKKGEMVDMFCRNVWTEEGPAIHIKMKGVETAISPEDAKDFAQIILRKVNDAEFERRLAAYLVNELDFLLLTKRPENVWAAVHRHDDPDGAGGGHYWQWPDNLWLGTSVENQKTADERIPHLLDLPAQVRFLSCEPLLGPVNLGEIRHCLQMIDWVIVGGESGDNARPMHPEWARGLRDQCRIAGIPFLFKQWGEWIPDGNPGDQVLVRYGAGTWCDGLDDFLTGGQRTGFQDGLFVLGRQHMQKVGKKKAGRELDGVTYDGLPAPSQEAQRA